MKILIAGATGQVGWRLKPLLSRIGETVAVGREVMDFTRPDTIRETIRSIRPHVIVNAAGRTHVDHAETEKALTHAVNAVAPGFVETSYMDRTDDALKESWLEIIPLRQFIAPDDIAGAYVFLAESRYMTGTLLTADAGFTLGRG